MSLIKPRKNSSFKTCASLKAVFIFLFFCSLSGKACGIPPECRDIKAVVQQADLVVRGEIIRTQVLEPKPGQMQTIVAVRVDEYVKGEGASELLLKVPGGCAKGFCMEVAGASSFRAFRMGQKGYLCLMEPEGNEYDEGRFFSPACGRGMLEELE